MMQRQHDNLSCPLHVMCRGPTYPSQSLALFHAVKSPTLVATNIWRLGCLTSPDSSLIPCGHASLPVFDEHYSSPELTSSPPSSVSVPSPQPFTIQGSLTKHFNRSICTPYPSMSPFQVGNMQFAAVPLPLSAVWPYSDDLSACLFSLEGT
jgi:hypothetical protein